MTLVNSKKLLTKVTRISIKHVVGEARGVELRYASETSEYKELYEQKL